MISFSTRFLHWLSRHRLPLSIIGILLPLYTLIYVSNNLSTPDEVTRYLMTDNFCHGRGFRSEYTDRLGNWKNYGAAVSKFGDIHPLLASPLYFLSEIFHPQKWTTKVEDTIPISGDNVPVNRYALAYVLRFNAVIATLLCLVFYYCSLLLTGGSARVSWCASLLLGLCTIIAVYTQLFLTEILTGFLLLSAFYFMLREDLKSVVLCGFFAGLLPANNTLFALATPVFFAAILLRKNTVQPVLKRLPFFVLGALPGVVFFLYEMYLRRGSGYQAEKGFITPLAIGVFGNLLSPGKSIFVFSPVLIVACAQFPRFYGTHRFAARVALILTTIFLLIYSKWWAWFGGVCWGPRFLIPIVPLLMLGLLPFLMRWGELNRLKRLGFLLLVVASFWVQVSASLTAYTWYHYACDRFAVRMQDNFYARQGAKEYGTTLDSALAFMPDYCPPYLESVQVFMVLKSGQYEAFYPSWLRQGDVVFPFLEMMVALASVIFAFRGKWETTSEAALNASANRRKEGGEQSGRSRHSKKSG